jgi:hypothetical protein
MLLKSFSLLVLFCTVAACGSVDWFPPYKRLPTTPDQFSFPDKTGVALGAQVTSGPITVSGITADAPISISDTSQSNSQYSINGGALTSAAGTVKNGDQVTITHTSASIPGGVVISTLSIGNVTGTFKSVTQLVATPAFNVPRQVATVNGVAVMQANATLSAVDGVAGTHVISIKDSLSSANARYQITNPDGVTPIGLAFTNQTQTLALLNGNILFVQGLLSTTSSPVTTTLTIDGANFLLTFNSQSVTVTRPS